MAIVDAYGGAGQAEQNVMSPRKQQSENSLEFVGD